MNYYLNSDLDILNDIEFNVYIDINKYKDVKSLQLLYNNYINIYNKNSQEIHKEYYSIVYKIIKYYYVDIEEYNNLTEQYKNILVKLFILFSSDTYNYKINGNIFNIINYDILKELIPHILNFKYILKLSSEISNTLILSYTNSILFNIYSIYLYKQNVIILIIDNLNSYFTDFRDYYLIITKNNKIEYFLILYSMVEILIKLSFYSDLNFKSILQYKFTSIYDCYINPKSELLQNNVIKNIITDFYTKYILIFNDTSLEYQINFINLLIDTKKYNYFLENYSYLSVLVDSISRYLNTLSYIDINIYIHNILIFITFIKILYNYRNTVLFNIDPIIEDILQSIHNSILYQVSHNIINKNSLYLLINTFINLKKELSINYTKNIDNILNIITKYYSINNTKNSLSIYF